MLEISKVISRANADVQRIVHQAQERNALMRQPGQSMMQCFESYVNSVLNKAREDCSARVTKALDETNNAVLAMVAAGSKGSNINIAQIIACVGQQNVEGKRIPNGWRDRTLPHFTKYDLSPPARGFVANSYLKGLTAQEFFFHMMGGREGLIDTGTLLPR
jgi:DNA-directed RNA polymerase II subunit RPB1